MGVFNIDVKLNEEADLYHPLDPNRETLSDEVVAYILDKKKDKPIGDSIRLTIFSEEPVDEAHARSVMDQWLKSMGERNRRERMLNIYRMVRLLIIGAIIIAISIAIQRKVGAVWYTIISTIGAFSIWEAGNIVIIKNPKLKSDRLVIKRASEKVEITFKNNSQ